MKSRFLAPSNIKFVKDETRRNKRYRSYQQHRSHDGRSYHKSTPWYAKQGSRELYSNMVYFKSSLIVGTSALLFISPFLIDRFIGRARKILLSDDEIIDFEKSKLNAEKRVDYERAFRDQVLKPEEPLTWMDNIRHYGYYGYRSVRLGIIFLPVVFLAPLAILFKFLRPLWWRTVKISLETAGGCWIKLGQWASTRPDLFPEDVVEQLSHFQNKCPAHPFSYTREVIEEGYGVALEDIFDDFQEEPIASGAIAQVYRARLKIDSQEIAVKILHPGIRKEILVDLNMMKFVSRVFMLLPSTEWTSMDEAIEQFSINMANQISMRKEARNLMRFGQNFDGDRHVCFPSVINNMTTDNVLVETFEHGQTLNAFFKSNPDKRQQKMIAKLGLHTYLKMILVHNFIHADLHPGNILVRKHPRSHDIQLVLLDTGFVAELTDQDWNNFKQLFKCIVQGDGKAGARLMVEHARQTKIRPEEKELFMHEMDELFYDIRNQKISKIDIGKFLTDILNVVRRYKVKIESNFATLCVATVILEGIGRQLDPDINILDQSIPFLLWSEKATVEDRIIFLREKVKDEFEKEGDNEVPFWRKIHNILKPALDSFQLDK